MKFRTAKVIIFNLSEFRAAVTEYWDNMIANNVGELVKGGLRNIYVPEIILKQGIATMTAEELVGIGQTYVDTLFDDYSYQILTVIVIDDIGKTYCIDPHLNEEDSKTFLKEAEVEEFRTDAEIADGKREIAK